LPKGRAGPAFLEQVELVSDGEMLFETRFDPPRVEERQGAGPKIFLDSSRGMKSPGQSLGNALSGNRIKTHGSVTDGEKSARRRRPSCSAACRENALRATLRAFGKNLAKMTRLSQGVPPKSQLLAMFPPVEVAVREENEGNPRTRQDACVEPPVFHSFD